MSSAILSGKNKKNPLQDLLLNRSKDSFVTESDLISHAVPTIKASLESITADPNPA